jgi:hypothetical protein
MVRRKVRPSVKLPERTRVAKGASMLDTTKEARADGRLREEMMIWLTTVRSG